MDSVPEPVVGSALEPVPDRFALSGDVSVAMWHLRWGAPTSRVLVAHATGFCALAYGPLSAALDEMDNLDVWGLDVRGHGRSSRSERMDWASVASDVLAALTRLEWTDEPVHGIGHSMGGAAMLLAEQARPGTFASLTVVEPIVFPSVDGLAEGDNPLAAAALRRREHFESLDAARANFSAKRPMATFVPEALDGYLRGGFTTGDSPTADGRPSDGSSSTREGGIRLCCAPATEAECYRMGTRHGAFERLSEVGCPVAVVCGTDGGFPAQVAPAIAAALPFGELHVLDGAGHFAPFERPDAVAEVVTTTIRSANTADKRDAVARRYSIASTTPEELRAERR